jgi:hypothetical protein
VALDRRRAGKALLVLSVVLIVVFLLLMPPTQNLLRKYLVDPLSPHYPEEVRMEVSRTIVLEANGGHITEYEIDLPRARSITEGGVHLQTVTNVEVTPTYDQYYDGELYDTMVWDGQDLFGSMSVNVTTTVVQTLHRWELDDGSVLGREEVPQYLLDRYLDDEWKIVVDDPVMEELSEDIVGDEDNVYLIARAIYDWIDANVDYHVWTDENEPLSSLETYERRKGDCDDQSMLFCALARAAGVPAWLQLGAVYDRTTGQMGGHGWVQMFMPTEEGGTNVTIDIVNDNFLIWMPNLFCEYTDTGEEGDLMEAYHSIRVTYTPGPAPTVTAYYTVLSYEESEGQVVLSCLAIREDL